MIFYLLFGISYGFAAAVMPGPFITYLVTHTLEHGPRKTLPAVFAPLISDIPIALLVMLVLIKVPAGMIQLLRIGGGIFILYLAWGAVQAWRQYNVQLSGVMKTGSRSLYKAVTVNLLNPNPYLGWSLVMGPLILKGWQESSWNPVALLGSFYLTMIISLVVIIMLFGTTRQLGPKVTRSMLGLSAIALAAFGLFQLGKGIIMFWQS